MAIRTISELDIAGRRVFIRVDFNVPFSANGAVSDDTRIRESLPTITHALASYTDVYVNDAFGTAHRAHASTAGITKFVADKGIGLLMEREVKFLGRLLGEVERPFVTIIGGAKVSDKIGVLENLLVRVDQLLIGGAMANTFLKAKGGKLGRSLAEDDKLALARAFLKNAEEANVDVLLPRDV